MSLNDTKCTLRIPNSVCKDFEERAVDMDIVLPDYCPDVTAILKCTMRPMITSRFQSGDRYTVDGQTMLRILYLTEDRLDVFSYEVHQPFSVSFRSSGATHHYAEVKNDYVNCRAVGPRRMDIHGAFRVFLDAVGQGDVEVFAAPKTNGIHCRTRTVSSTVPICEAEKSFAVEEAINLGAKIDRLIYAESAISSFETKALANKLIIKGVLCLKGLYVVSGATACLKQEIPFSQIVDVMGLSTDWSCDVRLQIAECETHLQTAETGGTLLFLNSKINACVYCSNTDHAEVVLDAYSVDHPLLCEMMPLNISSEEGKTISRLTAYQTMNLPDNTHDIVDIWGEVKTCEKKESDTATMLSCCVTVGFIAKDDAGQLGYYERLLDFDLQIADVCDSVSAKLIDLTKVMNGEQCRVQAEFEVSMTNGCKESLSVVAQTVADEQNAFKKCASAIRIVYADAGESVWEIAKRHHSGMDDILAENDLTDDKIVAPTMLMIPIA